VRTNAVTAPGPPTCPTIRFAAVLSLTVIAASQMAAPVIPSATCNEVTGEYVTSCDFW
jgi:hypothetical protein